MEIQERKRFTDEEKKDILKITNCKCGHCGRKLNLDTMTIEHIYPISKGGDNSEYNIIALCKECNNLKSNFIYEPFTFYPYIKDNLIEEYQNRLMIKAFSNSTDKNLFGSLIRRVYMSSYNNRDFLTSKKHEAEARRILTKIGKPVEIRNMYSGDLNEEALKVLRQGYQRMNDSGEYISANESQLNEMLIRDIMKYSSSYGFYTSEKLLGMVIYTNIDYLEINEKIKDKIHEDGFKKAYIKSVMAIEDKYVEQLAHAENILAAQYTAVTDNLVILPDYRSTSILRCNSEQRENCISKIKFKGGELIINDEASLNLIINLADDYYETFKENVLTAKRIVGLVDKKN